jgi:hypothetical protein
LQKSVFEAAPFLSLTDILPPRGAGKDGESTISLAPFGGKGLRVRGLKLKRIAVIRLMQKSQIRNKKLERRANPVYSQIFCWTPFDKGVAAN